MGAVSRAIAPALLGAALLAGACADLGPESGAQRLVIRPTFALGANAADDNPALLVDNIRVVLVNEAGDTLVDQVILWPLDQDTLRAEVVVEVAGTETFTYRLEGRQGDQVLFSAGPFQVVLTAGAGAPTVVEPVLEYAGPEAALVTIRIADAPAALAAGGTVTLAAVGEEDGGGEVTDPLVAWISLDTLVATVDPEGVVTARPVASGTARIVARVAFRSLADTVGIPVVPAAVAVVPGQDTINALGFTLQRHATATTLGGEPLAGGTFTWTSRDPTVVGVRDVRGDTAILGGVAVGSAWVVADLGGVSDSIRVEVRQVVSAAAVLPTRIFFGVADAIPLMAVAVDSGGSVVPGAAFTWTSSSGAASVNATGVVTGQSMGAAEVTATFQGASGFTRVQVGAAGTAQAAVGDFHACRLDTDGQAWCWGDNEFGQLGDGTTTLRSDPVAVLQGGLVFTALAAGGNHTCALATDSGTYCWGGNGYGQLGNGGGAHQSTPVAVTGPTFAQIAAGGRHTCGLTAAGAAHCWGLDEAGQLGDGVASSASAGTPQPVLGGLTFVSLGLGWLHSCGLTGAGEAYCWGRGLEGQLGGGVAADTALPAAVSGGHSFASIAAGPGHVCGVTAANQALCWGYNSSGQLGTGTLPGSLVPAAVSGSPAFTAMVAGWVHGCGLDGGGVVSCWGSNAALELGRGDPRATRVPLAYSVGLAFDGLVAGGRRTCATSAGILVCWGGIPPEQLGRGTLISPAPGLFDGTSATR